MHNFDKYIEEIPNFPKEGVMFKDVSPLLANPMKFRALIEEMGTKISNQKYDVIIGMDARGFIFASAMSTYCNRGLVMARKKGKLPGNKVSMGYELEYGTESVEIQIDKVRGKRVLIVDDVMATGGTFRAVCECVEAAGGQVAGIVSVIELKALNGRSKLQGYEVYSVLQY